MNGSLQEGKTRWTHYRTGYHFVWIPKYRRKVLRERFPHLKRLCGKDHLWTQAYYVGTVGQVSAETVRRYVEECQGQMKDSLSSQSPKGDGNSRSNLLSTGMHLLSTDGLHHAILAEGILQCLHPILFRSGLIWLALVWL